MKSPNRRAGRLIVAGAALLVFFALLSVVLDWREVSRLVADADWALLPLALSFSALSP